MKEKTKNILAQRNKHLKGKIKLFFNPLQNYKVMCKNKKEKKYQTDRKLYNSYYFGISPHKIVNTLTVVKTAR